MEHEIFKTNPHLEKVFVTTDGEVFYNDNDAKNHAKTLEDKGVEILFNTKFLEVVDDENVSEDDSTLAEFEADAKAKVDAKAKAETDAKAKTDADTKVKADADAKKKVVIKPNTKK